MTPNIYRPQGACLDILYAQERELVVVGPAGTGKSRAGLTKQYMLAERYPGSRHLITRQTRESLTDSLLVTLERDVIPEGHPCLGKIARQNRHSYKFPNGSEIVALGLDKPTKLFSTEWDTILVGEAIETLEDTWESFDRALRSFKVPYQQKIADTNPGPPTHWLKRRIDQGKCRHIPTTHRDNARYWDERKQCWTPEGEIFLSGLRGMTGSRYTRLYLGEWGVAEGARWPYLDPQLHRFSKEELWPSGIPEWYTKWVSIDHGFGNPYCALWHAADREGNLYTYREDYGAGFTADIQAERVVELSKANERYEQEILDPSMWHQDPRARGKMPQEVSAADIYVDRFGKEPMFGPVVPGTRVTRENMFLTLDKFLRRDNDWPNWFIDYSCKNLWDELLGAVLNKNQTTGIVMEDLDPRCPDHAITSAGFGFVTRYPTPPKKEPHPFEGWDSEEYNRQVRQQQEEESEREFARRHSTNRLRI